MKIEPVLNTYTNESLNESLRSLQECSSQSFEESSPIPPSINHSIHFYNHEQDRIFNQEWICIGRCDDTKMAKIKVTKVKSAINRTQTQKRTLEALGLKKIGQTVEHDDTPNILGMVNKVKHLVSMETL